MEASVSMATLYNNLALKERIMGLRAVTYCQSTEIGIQKTKVFKPVRALVPELYWSNQTGTIGGN